MGIISPKCHQSINNDKISLTLIYQIHHSFVLKGKPIYRIFRCLPYHELFFAAAWLDPHVLIILMYCRQINCARDLQSKIV